ncbi:Flp pilus assembly protein CpaB [Stakelama tenebrarum]|uniref:Flp pilus assembly protein CpaB n=1 Tax=Stakelama tenebrarum TaxID=2711215 RepID=A0A6G6Y3K7_9SPHN|nr:Flp pilus assembly protein CpaB [Sphingosinithalassobacter tenebrarum]QIG79146.1 Flp pilus assembly protein CpaB [Sphingosinithalassobacter tenebrarum]
MDGRKIILLVGALVVALITAFMARNLMVGSSAPSANAVAVQPGQPSKEVLVATRELPVGTILDASAMKFVAWPEELIEGAYYLQEDTDPAQLQGTVVRIAIPAGQPVAQGALVKPGDRGFLAAALGPGMRAVTVPVSAQSSVAGFVFPGDRVDLILTQEVAGGGDGPPLKASETVLRNLRVLATDQRTDQQKDEEGNTVVNPYSTVTLEVTPRIAEQISVAQTIGQISLSLRSIADNSQELEEAIASGEIDVPEDADAERAMLARREAAPISGRSTYSTGADISRFQRSTVPGKGEETRQFSPPPGFRPDTANTPPAAMPVPTGPVVRVARGNNLTVVPVGQSGAATGGNN